MAIKKRNLNIEYLRVFACLSVILIHIFAAGRTDFPNHTEFEENFTKITIQCLHFCVPIFFMITGALFLNKKDINLKKYIKKYLLALLIFGVIFAIFEEIFNKNFTLAMPFKAFLNTIQGNSWGHMWYLHDLIGVMLMIPILIIVKEKDEKKLKYMFYLLIVSSFIIPLLDTLLQINIKFTIPLKSEHLAFVILGYESFKFNKKINLKKSILGMIICFIVLIIICYIAYTYDIKRLGILGHYNSILIMCLAFFIFKTFLNINFEKIPRKITKIVSDFSYSTFGIYLIHMLWINIIYKLLKFNIYGNYLFLKVLLLFISITLLSYISDKIMKKIPLLKKIV